MKKSRIISLILVIAFALSSFAFVSAEGWEDFTDISGHWAEATMKRAYEDKLVTGYGDGILAPDENITIAQMSAILTRVLGATQSSSPESMGIQPEEWYYEVAGRALYLGLIDSSMINLDAPMLRQDAMAMLAKAFSLVPARPDYSVLDRFSDSGDLSAKNRAPMAALVSQGYVEGSGGSLMANSNITRAEFVTALYRVAENYLSDPSQLSGVSGGSVVKGGNLMGRSLSGRVWLDCSTSNVSLLGVTGDTLTLRGHILSAFNLGSGTKLNTLVVDCGSCKLSPGALSGSTIDTLRFAGGGSVTLTDSVIKNVELTGNYQSAVIGGSHDSLVISGSHNTVTLSEGASIGEVVILGSDNTVNDGGKLSVNALSVDGSKNELTLGGTLDGDLTLGGSDNTVNLSEGAFTGDISVSGSGNALLGENNVSASSLSVEGEKNKAVVSGSLFGALTVDGHETYAAVTSEEPLSAVTVRSEAAWVNLSCADISSLDVTGNYNTVVKDGGGRLASMKLSGNNNTFILNSDNTLTDSLVSGNDNTLTVNGRLGKLTLDGRKTVVNGSGSADSVTVNGRGSAIEIPVADLVDNGVTQEEIDRVLGLVSYQYKGNYTLQWAEQHDYEDSEKEIWVNARNYSSKTEYLLWVNLAMQRVNFFKGQQGEWELTKSCIVGTGAPGSSTPVGVYYTTYKQAAGWTTGSYTCRPVVGFKINSGYAFHSRLYYPNTTRLKDASIGFPVSHGCVRMYDEDVNYIFEHIPLNTTVVVY